MPNIIVMILIYILTGALTGFLSGLFGIGGGLLLVPVLAYSFELLQLPAEHIMHMAVGTSLAIIIVSVSSSSFFHYKINKLDTTTYLKLALFTAIGSFSGAHIASYISNSALKLVFTIYVSLVSIKMIFYTGKENKFVKATPTIIYNFVGLIIGLKSSILGIGGGTISIPFLIWRGHRMIDSVGISAALGIPIAIIGSLTYMYIGVNKGIDIQYAIGFIYLPALLCSAFAIPIFSKIGTRLAHRLDQKKLKKVFGMILIPIAVKSIISLL